MSGIIGGPRQYDGPGLGSGPWKCPACAVPNDGPIDAGCASCGSGSARPFKHVGPPPEIARPPTDLHLTPPIADRLPYDGVSFEKWWEINQATLERLDLKEALRLAWESSAVNMTARTMAAPPVTADLAELAPEGKPRRTIIAALELFKDQVLREAADEIANGEWCSIEETEEIISSLKREEGSL